MPSPSLHLWCAYPGDLLNEEAAAACASLLSEEETARWRRFHFDRHRREFLATHALLRSALSSYRAIRPATWRFSANEHGKPALVPACGLRFNLSNALDLVVCLIAEKAELGVDVEAHTRADEILKLAPDVFSAQERAQLEPLSQAGKLDRALSLWTLKEAYIKARGMGLSLPLDKFSFLFDAGNGIRLEVAPELNDEPTRWRFRTLDHAGHRIAMVVESAAAGSLELLEARPPLAVPVAVPLSAADWYPLG
jgi:4'-phosphopantetheinyl transferase